MGIKQVTREGLTEKGMLEEKPERGKEASQGGTWGKTSRQKKEHVQRY